MNHRFHNGRLAALAMIAASVGATMLADGSPPEQPPEPETAAHGTEVDTEAVNRAIDIPAEVPASEHAEKHFQGDILGSTEIVNEVATPGTTTVIDPRGASIIRVIGPGRKIQGMGVTLHDAVVDFRVQIGALPRPDAPIAQTISTL